MLHLLNKKAIVTFIEQKGDCIIKYFGRPCNEFAERVWPIKIYDGARITLFNKGLLYRAFSSFLFSTSVQYLMIPSEEVELDDVTSYNIS
jgi:hypothetical protein